MASRIGWAGAVAIAVLAVLLVLSPLYGFHRDELYFVVAGRHPAFGYVDQPPLTPLLSAASVALLGVTPIAIRILPAFAVAACVWLAGDMARRFGGGPRAQLIAAVSIVASGYLAAGHLASTTTYDLLAWTVILWLAVRLLDGADPRLWAVLGLVAGIGLENKHLVAFLGVGLAAGLLLARRWDVLRSPWAWSALAIAALLWLPNLAWQAANDWPQLEMAERLAARAAAERDSFLVEVVLLGGSLLAFVPVLGAGRLLVAADARPWRPIGWAAVVVVAIVVVTNGKSYYMFGPFAPLAASGAVLLDRWIARGRTPVRGTVVGALAAVSVAVMAVLTLPIVPAASLASTPVAELYSEAGEQLGWPELVAEVTRVADGLTPAEREGAIIVTSNYGEAGALELLGEDLPPVYSGHNSYWDWGPPPDGRTVVILVTGGGWQAAALGDCSAEGRVDNGLGLSNDEQGTPVRVCRRVPASWADAWWIYRHLD